MPELPEVETVKRGLEPAMKGRTVKSIRLNRKDVRIPFPLHIKELEGRKIVSLGRRAKYLLIQMEKRKGRDDLLIVHLGMSGRMKIISDLGPYKEEKHDHMVIGLDNGSGVVFNDPRRFGMVMMAAADTLDEHPSFKALGPEPLSEDFSGKVLHTAIQGRKSAIKLALLDQNVVAGIGNIYACEGLYEARIDPRKSSKDLTAAQCTALVKALRSVLLKAIEAGGSSLRDHRQADGSMGYFQHSFLVYDREGEACPRCCKGGKKEHIVHRMTQSGRSTFFCPTCQV